MIRHAMSYHQMTTRLLEQIGDSLGDEIKEKLAKNQERLVTAEVEIVASYREWRGLISALADAGVRQAQALYDMTVWDLT